MQKSGQNYAEKTNHRPRTPESPYQRKKINQIRFTTGEGRESGISVFFMISQSLIREGRRGLAGRDCCLVLSSFTVAHCHVASPQTSFGVRLSWMRDKRTPRDVCGEANCHGKTNNLTAKTSWPHGKTENLTAKPKTSQQNQKPHGKTKYREVFCFCREVCFSFAVRFLVLPRQLWATRLLCSWENLTKWTILCQEPLPCRLSDRLDAYFWGEGAYHLRKCQTRQVLARIWRKKTIISSLPNDQSGRPVLTLYSLRGRRSKGKGRLDFLLIRLHRFKNRRFFVVILLGFSSL